MADIARIHSNSKMIIDNNFEKDKVKKPDPVETMGPSKGQNTEGDDDYEELPDYSDWNFKASIAKSDKTQKFVTNDSINISNNVEAILDDIGIPDYSKWTPSVTAITKNEKHNSHINQQTGGERSLLKSMSDRSEGIEKEEEEEDDDEDLGISYEVWKQKKLLDPLSNENKSIKHDISNSQQLDIKTKNNKKTAFLELLRQGGTINNSSPTTGQQLMEQNNDDNGVSSMSSLTQKEHLQFV